MQLGMIGLGRMGANMVRRLMARDHACVVHDRATSSIEALVAGGATAAATLDVLVEALEPPRAVWVMVPAGAPTETVIAGLGDRLSAGDVVIDGGNSHFKDDVRRAGVLSARGVEYVDVGTSGGVWGAERGYCLMIGGEDTAVARLDPIFRSLAPGPGTIARTPGRETLGGTSEQGYLHCGPVGAGHFVKMVHNGIEYGLMQAYAEGFDIMRHATTEARPPEMRYDLNVRDVAELWRRGSVVGSWLLDLTAMALAESPALEPYGGHVSDSGEGRWAVETAVEQAVPAHVLSASLYARFRSRQTHSFADKVLSAMRQKFGGHVEPAAAAAGE
jgi:6-phosphogluconate dehydrogenase